jgi:hypothetical protein
MVSYPKEESAERDRLARANPDARVLLTTFSDTLADALCALLRRLVSNEPRLAERIDVHSLDGIGIRLYTAHFGKPDIASPDVIRELLEEVSRKAGPHKFSPRFLYAEWEQVADAWQLESWEAYRSPFPGSRWGWISAGAPGRCGSTTGPRTRYARRPIGCWGRGTPSVTASSVRNIRNHPTCGFD